MFKDKLDDQKFTLKNGKNYRTPVQMDLFFVKNEIAKMGYRVLAIDQVFRNVHAKIKKGHNFYFLKLASTKEISERVRNEINWNLTIFSILRITKFRSFIVPPIYDFGEIMGCTYYISDFYENNFLALKNPAKIFRLKEFVFKIVDTNIFLMKLPKLEFLRDKLELNNKWSIFKEFYQTDTKLVTDLSEFGLEKILCFEKNSFNLTRVCVNHGDFVPWHMFENKENFILIDGEHASSKLPYGYDVAYFYHRVYTGAESPSIANEYLNLLYSKIPINKRKEFKDYFYSCLANRIISGFWHAKNENTKFDFHIKIKNDFIKKRII